MNKSVYPFYRFTEEKKKDIEILKIFFKNLLNDNKNSDFYKRISEIEKKEIKNIFMLFPERFLKDKDVIRNIYSCCIQHSSLNRSYFYNITPIDMELREDKEFMLELINKNYHIYESLIPSLKNDKDMMKIAMKESYGRSLKFFNLEYKIDLEFLQELNKQAPVEKRLLPNFLRADIGAADISSYLESAILRNALNDKLSEKDNNTRRMKI